MDLHQIRYTFVYQIFDHYKVLGDTINDSEKVSESLTQLPHWFVWNYYK